MLIFYNNFLSSKELLFDNNFNRYYLLIHKNGSTSLEHLSITNPARYSICTTDSLIGKEINEITVFIRNPIERYISGIATQMSIYGMQEHIFNIMFRNDHIPVFDSHTIPQFWFLLAVGKMINCNFNIKPMDKLFSVDNTIQQLNKTTINKMTLTPYILNRLNHFYTEDVVLFNQFLNKTVSIDQIKTQILLENNFINDLTQYKECSTLYFN
jgi:hypothetical protein